jgi:hypothetical protein
MYWFGFAIVATIVLTVAYFLTEDDIFKIPFWLIFFPTAVLLFYASSVGRAMKQTLRNESIEQKLTGLTKKDYIGYKIGDDRSAKSFGASALSSGVLSGSAILGPFLRADNRL